MQADENTNGSTCEKEPKPCPFCGDALTKIADWMVNDPVWEHPYNGCILEGYRLRWRSDVKNWNRRTPTQKARIRKLEPLREEPEELSDTERQEAGYPATREELVEALRECYGHLHMRVVSQHIADRIFDILKREENHD